MRIRCRFCKSIMDGSTFSAHVETIVLNFLTEPAKVLFSKALEFYMMMQFRDGWDNHMAVYANTLFNIHCSKCKNVDCWDPYSEKVVGEKKHKKEKQITV